MAEVKVDVPGTEKGADVEVLHLGVFPNGETSEVSDEAVSTWQAITGNTWPEGGTLDTTPPAPVAEPEAPVVVVIDDATGEVTTKPKSKAKATADAKPEDGE